MAPRVRRPSFHFLSFFIMENSTSSSSTPDSDLLEFCKLHLEDIKAMAEDPQVGLAWDWSLTAQDLASLIEKADAQRFWDNLPH